MKAYRWIFLILVTGFFAGCNKDSEPELVGDWQRRAVFPRSERSHAAYFVIGNKGYVIGGYNGTTTLRREVFEFDHTGGSGQGIWTQKRNFPQEAIARQQAVGFAFRHMNGKDYGYVGTGYGYVGKDWITLKDFWRYDKDNDSWEQVAPLPDEYEGVEGLPRQGAIAFSLQDKSNNKWYGYIGCGYKDDPEREDLTDFWRFDPEGETPKTEEEKLETNDDKPWIGKWTPVFGYGGSKRTGASVFVIDNKAYICNGKRFVSNVYTNDFWRFDPNETDPDRVWIGSPKALRTMANVNRDEDYDDDYGTLGRAFGVAYVVPVHGRNDFRGHIVGGNNSNWEYDHFEDLWVQRTYFFNNQTKFAREGMISFSFPETGRAFVGLGKTSSAYYDEIWEFIPLIDDETYSDLIQ